LPPPFPWWAQTPPAGIGGMSNTGGGSLYIHGGGIDVRGADNAAGLGGGTVRVTGVPGAGLIMLPLVTTQAGLPIEGVAMIAGIDAILDMIRTSLNITGDAAVATVVARTEGADFTEVE